MHADPLAETRRGRRRAASGVQNGRLDRIIRNATRKQIRRRTRQPPIAAQNAQERRRQHRIALLAAFAMLDPHHHAVAVDIADLQHNDLGDPEPRRVSRRQRDARLQAGNGFQKSHDLVAAQDRRQLARRSGVNDPLGDRLLAKRHAVKEPKRANDLVERSPRHALGRKMHLVGSDVFQSEPVGGNGQNTD